MAPQDRMKRVPVIPVEVEREAPAHQSRAMPGEASDPFNDKTPTLIPRIGARMRKVLSMKNGGMKSGTRERVRVGASDLPASPLGVVTK